MRPKLLFISPRTPATSGGGAAMRAGMLLEALAADYDVFLLVVPVYGLAAAPEEYLAEKCAQAIVTPAPTAEGPLPDPESLFPGVRFQAVHVFRLVVAALANRYLLAEESQRPFCALDLDDFESVTRLRIAALYQENGDAAGAARERETAAQFAAMESHYLPLFDRVYVCSGIDRQRLSDRYISLACAYVAPNAVRLPRALPARRPNTAFTLLFAGTMAYYPNEDAVAYLCRDILPRLRRRTALPVKLMVVGNRPSPKLLAMCSACGGVSVTGEVPDMACYYAEADAAVVPLRAGGGTRIKILEACSYRRPVVSTRLGAEGLAISPGKEILLADSAEEFADACLLPMNESAAADSIAAAGYRWVRENHTIDQLRLALGVRF